MARSGVLPLGVGEANIPALAAGQLSQNVLTYEGIYGSNTPYTVPNEPRSRPRSSIAINRMYLPVAVLAENAVGAPQAALANLMLTLSDGDTIFWAWSQTVNLTPGASGRWSSANLIITEDLINPIQVDEQELPELWTAVSFDKDSGGQIYVGQQLPNINAGPVPSSGAAYYTTPDM